MSSASSTEPGMSAHLATDGDAGTRWASGQPWDDNEWLAVNLSASFHIVSVSILWEAAYANEYEVSVSMDGAQWKPVAHILHGKAGWVNTSLPLDTYTRWVRVKGVKRGSSYGYSIYSFLVYGLDCRSVPPPSTPTQSPTAPWTPSPPCIPSSTAQPPPPPSCPFHHPLPSPFPSLLAQRPPAQLLSPPASPASPLLPLYPMSTPCAITTSHTCSTQAEHADKACACRFVWIEGCTDPVGSQLVCKSITGDQIHRLHVTASATSR